MVLRWFIGIVFFLQKLFCGLYVFSMAAKNRYRGFFFLCSPIMLAIQKKKAARMPPLFNHFKM